ncbi:hypothetical protein ACX3O0_05110 [Homoserinimonas sp. A447]
MEWLTKLLADLWDFISTPIASIPSGLSTAAIVLSVIVYIRSERATPRPRLETESNVDFDVHEDLDPDGDPYDYQVLEFAVTNRANGTAYDVRVSISGYAKAGEHELGSLETDETKRTSFNWLDVPQPGVFQMTWWEHPKNKMRSKLIPYGGDHSYFRMP